MSKLSSWVKNSTPERGILAIATGGMSEVTKAIADFTGVSDFLSPKKAGGQRYPYPGGYEFPDFVLPEVTQIEALPAIDVEKLLREIGLINSETIDNNIAKASEVGRDQADAAFSQFQGFADLLAPGGRDLMASATKEIQAFIDRGLPSSVRGNATLADAGALNASGVRGGLAVRRMLANEMDRDIDATKYGIGEAQNIVNQARATAAGFAELGQNVFQNVLGQYNAGTVLSPSARIGFAFDERNYQTGVAQFNAGAVNQFSMANANTQNEFAITNATMQQQQQQFMANMQMQQQLAQQNRQTQLMSSLFSVAGTALGATLGGPVGAAVGSQIGGQIGNQVGSSQGASSQSYFLPSSYYGGNGESVIGAPPAQKNFDFDLGA